MLKYCIISDMIMNSSHCNLIAVCIDLILFSNYIDLSGKCVVGKTFYNIAKITNAFTLL